MAYKFRSENLIIDYIFYKFDPSSAKIYLILNLLAKLSHFPPELLDLGFLSKYMFNKNRIFDVLFSSVNSPL